MHPPGPSPLPGLETRPVLTVGNPFSKGLPMFETLQLAARGQMSLPSNRLLLLDYIEGNWQRLMAAFPCWTGTMAAYESGGRPFGETIVTGVWTKLVYHVPKEHVGKADCLLVSEFPALDIRKDGRTYHVYPKTCAALPGFPSGLPGLFSKETSGIHELEPNFYIPVGSRSEASDPGAGYLWRRDSAWAGLISRNIFIEDPDLFRIVDMTRMPSERLGLVRIEAGTGGEACVDPQGVEHNGGPYRGHCTPEGPRPAGKEGAGTGLADALRRFLGFGPKLSPSEGS